LTEQFACGNLTALGFIPDFIAILLLDYPLEGCTYDLIRMAPGSANRIESNQSKRTKPIGFGPMSPWLKDFLLTDPSYA
jgi:hypothetical protein